VLGCPVKDLTGGFNMWTKDALEKIGLRNIISKGYSFQVEMKYRAWAAGCALKEIPIVFTDRKAGISKMSRKIFFEALINVWKIKQSAGKNTAAEQFVKFAVTGGLGAVTNLVIFFLCADRLGLPEIPVSAGCFVIAGTQNYIINHKWSFAGESAGYAKDGQAPLSIKRWILFLCASLLGLAVNIAALTFVLARFAFPYKFIAQAAGIAAGMAVNFTFSKFFVWRKTREDQT
jgi:putative flippase GtrA